MIEGLHQYRQCLELGPLASDRSETKNEIIHGSFVQGRELRLEARLTSGLSPNAHCGIDLAILPMCHLRCRPREQGRHQRQEQLVLHCAGTDSEFRKGDG